MNKRKHGFKNMPTRKHKPGEHRISVIIKGEEKAVVLLGLQDASQKLRLPLLYFHPLLDFR